MLRRRSSADEHGHSGLPARLQISRRVAATYLHLRARTEGRGSLSGATVARLSRRTHDATRCAPGAGELQEAVRAVKGDYP
jgi:hypothetical protein